MKEQIYERFYSFNAQIIRILSSQPPKRSQTAMIHILINLFIKGIRIQNILVVDSQENGSSRVLLFGKFNGEDLLVRE